MPSFGRPLDRLVAILRQPGYWAAATRGTPASFEHEDVVAFVAPATVIDVGANEGQFALAARVAAPTAQIIAFEPLKKAADVFRRNFQHDSRTTLQEIALSNRNEPTTIYITNRPDSSSLLRPGNAQAQIFNVFEVAQTSVGAMRLDEALQGYDIEQPCMLKLDVQGAELRILEGAGYLLDRVSHVYVETSFVTLYDEQPLFQEIFDFLVARQFVFAGAMNTSFHRRYGTVQCDCLFVRQ